MAMSLVQGQACASSHTKETFPRAFDGRFMREMLSSPGDGSGEVSMLNWYQCGKTLHGDHLCQTGKINQHQRGKTGR